MEIVGDVKLPKAAKGKMKIHKIQNLNSVLAYIKEKGVRLVGIDAADILDENLKLILGCIWTIILRFDIQDISEDEMSAKDALLLWCQRKTKGYQDVNVTNFHTSWKDGLAFCALIHKHRPDLIDYDSLNKGDALGNLKLALDVADKHLEITAMIDPEDMIASIKPDERAVMTQVAAFYKCFAGYNKNEVAASKIANVLQMNQEHERMIQEYELLASNLLEWIPAAIGKLSEQPELSSVEASLAHLKSFAPFRTEEYPGKLQEKAVLEAHYSSLQTKLRLSGRSPYEPTEGKLITDIQAAWGSVDAADLANKKWSVEELHRNKMCKQKSEVFGSKANMHESWASEQAENLKADDYSGANLGALTAMIKKHEAFKAELEAKQPGVGEIGHLANELDDLRYGESATTNQRYANIYSGWEEIMGLSEQREANLVQAKETQEKLDALWLDAAREGAPLSSDLDEFIDHLTQGIFSDSTAEVEELGAALAELTSQAFPAFTQQYEAYMAMCDQCDALAPSAAAGGDGPTPRARLGSVAAVGSNPYALHSREEIASKWARVQSLVPERQANLAAEAEKQASRNTLKLQWAEQATAASSSIEGLAANVKAIANDQETKAEDGQAKLATTAKEAEAYQPTMDALETLQNQLEAELIFDNEHCPITIEQVRGQLQAVRISISAVEASLASQILVRDATNITDEQMDEFKASFNHFDKDKSGELDRLEFRGCLLSLGTDIPQVATGDDLRFNEIWKRVDPNGDGKATFTEFVAFMAEERADAGTKDDLLEQFKILSMGQPYITAAQLSDLNPELVAYCTENMAPYEGGPEGALDYTSFAAAAFGEDTSV